MLAGVVTGVLHRQDRSLSIATVFGTEDLDHFPRDVEAYRASAPSREARSINNEALENPNATILLSLGGSRTGHHLMTPNKIRMAWCAKEAEIKTKKCEVEVGALAEASLSSALLTAKQRTPSRLE